MADAAEQKARRAVRAAQARFEREQEELREARTKSRAKRRESFAQAQEAGLSLRDIGEEIGVHWTRIGEILREE